MGTSGSYDYSVTATDVITEAMEFIQVLGQGDTIDSADQTSVLRTLNMMVKQWSGNFDFAPGLKSFQRKIGYLILQSGQSSYTLGPSGDNATLTYLSTTMRIAGVSTDTTLQVTSTTGMTAADKIGIELDSGAIYWTTIASVTDGDTLVISAGLTGGAAIGNRIFTYTTKLMRPLYVESCISRDTDGIDTPLNLMTQDYYDRIANKTADGTPIYYRYNDTLTNGTLLLDVEPSDVTNVLRLSFFAPAEDYDAVGNDIAYPQQWFLPLSIGLAKLIAPKFGQAWTDAHENIYRDALAIAKTAYAETTDIYFQPELE